MLPRPGEKPGAPPIRLQPPGTIPGQGRAASGRPSAPRLLERRRHAAAFPLLSPPFPGCGSGVAAPRSLRCRPAASTAGRGRERKGRERRWRLPRGCSLASGRRAAASPPPPRAMALPLPLPEAVALLAAFLLLLLLLVRAAGVVWRARGVWCLQRGWAREGCDLPRGLYACWGHPLWGSCPSRSGTGGVKWGAAAKWGARLRIFA